MNKTTRPIEENEYDANIETIRDGKCDFKV